MAFHKKGSGEPALRSGVFTQVSDFMWMGCLISVSRFLPEEPPLRQKTEVLRISLPFDQELE